MWQVYYAASNGCLCLGHISQKGPYRAVPGLFLAFLGHPARDPGGSRPGAVHFFTSRGPRVTFYSNLKVTRAPARKFTTFQARKLPGRGSAGPLPGSARDTGTIFEGKPTGHPPAPLRDPGGSLWGPDLACRGPGRCFADAFTMSERVPAGTLV